MTLYQRGWFGSLKGPSVPCMEMDRRRSTIIRLRLFVEAPLRANTATRQLCTICGILLFGTTKNEKTRGRFTSQFFGLTGGHDGGRTASEEQGKLRSMLFSCSPFLPKQSNSPG
jgi:hypothetical protein